VFWVIFMHTPDFSRESDLHARGLQRIAGIDEAGRGAWAGPVVAAAVILPPDAPSLAALHGLNDSKKLTPRRREALFEQILQTAVAVGVGVSAAGCIDSRGIVPATRRAMAQAVTRLAPEPDYLLIDALPLPHIPLPQYAFFKADATSLSVAAASIVAKVTRDRLMVLLDAAFPGYGFARHKGYGTAAHRTALERLGPCKIHRHSFAPIRRLIAPR